MCVYGIDLGTTNSIIGCDNQIISGLVPSRVDLEKRDVIGYGSYNPNSFQSYKVNMTTAEEGKQPIEASSIVLNALKKEVFSKTGKEVKDVVISVPAYFSTQQREAVRQAADMSNLEVKALINEPTAAAISACSGKNGIFLVYDLGGGTFDCTLVSCSNKNYTVLGTDGIILGGDDLDSAIMQEFISHNNIPIFKQSDAFMSNLRAACVRAKEDMQGCFYTMPIKIYCDGYEYSLTPSAYKELVSTVFSSTVTVAANLINTKLPINESYTLVFVGGSTYCDYLRDYVRTSLNLSHSDILSVSNPNFTVADGVVKYASSTEYNEIIDVTKQISVCDFDGKALVVIPANSNLPTSGKIMVLNSEDTDTLQLKLYQGNSVIEANNDFIGELSYPYGMRVEKGTGDVEVTVTVDISGIAKVEAECITLFQPKKEITLKL